MCLVLLALREEESMDLAHVLLNVGLSLGSCDFFFFFFCGNCSMQMLPDQGVNLGHINFTY